VHIALLTGACTQLLRSNFEEFDIHDVPSNVSELKANPPSAWTPKLEQILSRSMSFTEYEMLSHPVMLLTVVSTTERDAVSAMQELASPHHVPPGFQNVRSSLIDVTRFIYHWYCFLFFAIVQGQYAPDCHRVYLLLHDAREGSGSDPNALFKKVNCC
jgi:hypothetical protein